MYKALISIGVVAVAITGIVKCRFIDSKKTEDDQKETRKISISEYLGDNFERPKWINSKTVLTGLSVTASGTALAYWLYSRAGNPQPELETETETETETEYQPQPELETEYQPEPVPNPNPNPDPVEKTLISNSLFALKISK